MSVFPLACTHVIALVKFSSCKVFILRAYILRESAKLYRCWLESQSCLRSMGKVVVLGEWVKLLRDVKLEALLLELELTQSRLDKISKKIEKHLEEMNSTLKVEDVFEQSPDPRNQDC